MLSSIFGTIAGTLVDKLIAPFTDIFKAYINKEITVEELRSRMVGVMLSSATQVEVAHSEALTKTYSDFMQAATKSRLMRYVWAAVALSQLGVLLWHQVGIPAIVYLTGHSYPSSGTTVQWAYALLGFCIGAGPLVLRTGPGEAAFDKWKQLIKK